MRHVVPGILGVLILVGMAFAAGAMLTKADETVQPLTYDSPIKVEEPKATKAGGSFTIRSTRCNNTGADLAVSVTVFFQSSDGKHLIPFTQVNEVGQVMGPRFDGVLSPGCRKDFQSTVQVPTTIPPGTWTFKGQVCYGGVALETKEECTGYSTEAFEVRP